MATESYYKGIKHVVHISTNSLGASKHCQERIGSDFAESVNHYVQKHGYKVLHVGAEWSADMDGKSCHHTIAVVGK